MECLQAGLDRAIIALLLACIFAPNSELTFWHGADGSRLTKGDVKGSAVPPGYGRCLITEAGSDQERIVGTFG